MAKREIIDELKMTATGEAFVNDADKTTVEACEGAIKLLNGATYMDGYKDGFDCALSIIAEECKERRK